MKIVFLQTIMKSEWIFIHLLIKYQITLTNLLWVDCIFFFFFNFFFLIFWEPGPHSILWSYQGQWTIKSVVFLTKKRGTEKKKNISDYMFGLCKVQQRRKSHLLVHNCRWLKCQFDGAVHVILAKLWLIFAITGSNQGWCEPRD